MKKPQIRPGESKRVRVNAMHFCRLVQLLMMHPQSYKDLTEGSGLADKTVRMWVQEMKRAKLVYLAMFSPDSRGYMRIPEFEWGNKPDARIKCSTSAERSARWREKQNQIKLMYALAGPINHLQSISNTPATTR